MARAGHPYRLFPKPLGAGGSAQVLQAEHRGTGAHVAFKRLRGKSEESRARLRREIEILREPEATLRPALVPVAHPVGALAPPPPRRLVVEGGLLLQQQRQFRAVYLRLRRALPPEQRPALRYLRIRERRLIGRGWTSHPAPPPGARTLPNPAHPYIY